MSTLMQRNENNPNDPIYYAPRWVRDLPADLSATGAVAKPQGLPPQPISDDDRPVPPRLERPDRDASYVFDHSEAKSLRETLEPATVRSPGDYARRSPRRRDWLGVVVWGTSAVAVSAVVALGLVLSLQYAKNPSTMSNARTTLVVSDGGGNINQMLPLGVRVVAPIPGATVGVHGLPLGAMMTTGKPANGGEWRIPLQDLGSAFVVPPNDFSGEVKLAVVLRAAEGGALVSNTVRLVWAPPAAQPVLAAPAQPDSTPSLQSTSAPQPAVRPPQSVEVIRQIDPKEIAILLKRADELVASGDLLPARALLQRAAEAGNARAAFVLAGTYDAAALKKFGAHGAEPNQELAQAWYQKAKAWGHKEAEPRLETLAISGR